MDILSADSLSWLQRPAAAHALGIRCRPLAAFAVAVERAGLGRGAPGELDHRVGVVRVGGQAALRCAAPRAVCCAPTAHPDVHIVRLEEDAQQIKVDQVRELIDSLALKSYRGGYKVGVIEGAEALNANGANAFPEDLGGTPRDTMLIMIARPNHRLPATIASRCLRLTAAAAERDGRYRVAGANSSAPCHGVRAVAGRRSAPAGAAIGCGGLAAAR
jgi:hypothetical protein